MMKKYFTPFFAVLMAAMMFSSCERSSNNDDPRAAFVGEYDFLSTGSIDLYAGAVKFYTLPMNEKGELSISLSDKENAVWVVVENDSSLAYVSGDQLFIDPRSDHSTFGELEMDLSFTYGKATLKDEELSLTTDVEVTASYRDYNLSGHGQVDVIATKKSH